MGMGLTTGPDHDMFKHIDRHPNAPMARLFKACLRSPILTARFRDRLHGLLRGPLSAEAMEQEMQRMRDAIAAEMPRHIRRWRRPLTYEAWLKDVEIVRSFARERPARVKAQAEAYLAQYPLP
jgi:hypothetical protein